MPVTARGMVQLTPDTTTSSHDYYYLNGHSPSLANIRTGLAVFALVIIARFCAVHVFAWLRRIRGADRPNLLTLLPSAVSKPPQHQHQQLRNAPSYWNMDKKEIPSPVSPDDKVSPLTATVTDYKNASGKALAIDPKWSSTAIGGGGGGGVKVSRHFMSRPPVAPPLTPPELSTTIFTFEDRPQPGDDSFMRQPNPDYMSSTSSIIPASSTLPRRRSYNRTLPFGVPGPQNLSDSAADLPFSPSSYPPGIPLPPPPAPLAAAGAQGIDVRGEVVGVLDSEGAGWTRHTRVYGGGVCLACAASGGEHGGFYGATVRPEEMR